MNPLRVLYWAELFPPYIGGAAILGSKLVRALRDRGHAPAVITSHRGLDLPDEDVLDGIAVHRFPFWDALQPGRFELFARVRRRLADLKARFRADVMHINFTGPSVVFHVHTAAAWDVPEVVAIRLALPAGQDAERSVASRLLGRASWVTANSKAMLAHTRALVPAIEPYSSVIYNGREAPSVEPAPLPFDPPRLLGIGRLGDEKGFDLAVDALPAISARFPGARLVLAGDGPERAALERRAAGAGIAPLIDFLGWVEPGRIPALLNDATVVVMPSRWEEAFGMVALEAALMARPIVAARVGGLQEVVAHGESGLTVERNDAAALAAAVVELLANPDEARALGRRARERALDRFSWTRYVNAYESLYDRVAREGRGS